MTRLLVLAAASLVVVAAAAAPARATRECDGFLACVPVAGPWVAVASAAGTARPHVRYRLACPKRFVVGGLDAELSDRGIDVSFGGALGSPVNPGITTTTAAVFDALYALGTARAPTFRPHVGCIPGRGGGARVPTAVRKVYPPGRPATWRVSSLRVRPGTQRAAAVCAAGERLVGSSSAVGFYTARPPAAALVRAVRAVRSSLRGRVLVAVHATPAVARVRTIVQVAAVCAGGQ